MFAEPPGINTITINSYYHEELILFYLELGIGFTKLINDKNEIFYYNKERNIKYIIYPVNDINKSTKNLILSFDVIDLEGYYEILIEIGSENVEKVQLEDGYKIVAKDPEGNLIHLYERNV